MWTFDEDYVCQNNHRKHAKGSSHRVAVPTRLLDRIRNYLNISWILRMRQPCVILVDISLQNALDQSCSVIPVIYPSRLCTAASF